MNILCSKSATATRHKLSPSVTVVTGRHDPSRSGRSAEITSHTITLPWIFSKSIENWLTVTNRHHPSPPWRVVTIRPDQDDPPTFPRTPLHRHEYFLSLSKTDKPSRTVNHPSTKWRVVTIRPDISSHTITPSWIFSKTIENRQTVTNRHHPKTEWRVVTIRPDRDDPPTFPHTPIHRNDYSLSTSPTDKQSRTVTIRHRCDGSSRSVLIGTIRRNFLAHHYTAMNIF